MTGQGAAEVLYLDNQEAVDRFLTSVTGAREVALDTEGASFHRFVDRIYLLQISTRAHSAIIDPLPLGNPRMLGTVLEDRAVEIVFHDADYDLRLLRQDYGWKVNNIFDTRVAAQLLGMKSFGLAALLERYFDVRLDKKHQRADWSMRPLSEDMLAYAAQDTRFLLQLRDILHDELESRGRLHWAREEFARLEQTRWEEGGNEDAFLRTKGARDLSRRELALLRELVKWRDDAARSLDRATFRVIGNEALLEISRRAPLSVADLSAIKGVPRGVAERGGNELLDAVKRGMAVPDAELPRFPKGQRWNKDPDFDTRLARLRSVRDEVAQKLDLDPGVLCSRERMEAVVRRNPLSATELTDIPELRAWQAEVLAEGFVSSLAAAS